MLEYKGLPYPEKETHRPEYETICSFGALILNDDLDLLLKVNEYLNRAGVEMGCPKQVVGFQAQGNEPGWALMSSRHGVSFTRQDGHILNAPPLPLSWRWPGGRPDRAEALLTLSTEGGALTAELTPRICRDTMADAVYGFTATVRVARPEPGGQFEGCAWLGSESLP